MTVMTTPMLFKNDPIRLSEISAKAPKAENWFQRKYNGILSKYHAYMDTVSLTQKLRTYLHYVWQCVCLVNKTRGRL